MSPQIKYAYKRHNTWIYRRTYPKALQPILGSCPQAIPQDQRMPPKPRPVWLSSTKPLQLSSRRLRPMPLLPLSPLLPLILPTAAQAPRLGVARPRYQRARLVGDGLVAELAQAYLTEASQRLRPGSYKSVRFALAAADLAFGERAGRSADPSTRQGGARLHHPALSQRAQVQGGEGGHLG